MTVLRSSDVTRVARAGGCLAAVSVTLSSGLARIATAAPATLSAAASPTPAATASPAAGVSDPCGGPGRLLATLNRPTIGYSACAVPKDSLLLEEGYQNTHQAGPDASVNAAYPQGFERFGVARGFELDVMGPAYDRMRAGASLTSGYNDLGLGFKYELPQSGHFTYALDGLLTAATGSDGFSNGGPSQTLNLDVSYALSPAMGIGTTLAASSTAGFYQSGDAPALAARYGAFDPSVVVTAQIPNDYQFYAELAGLTKVAPQGGGRVYTDFGVQKLVGRNLELDLEYGIDFTPVKGSRFRYFGTGFGLLVN